MAEDYSAIFEADMSGEGAVAWILFYLVYILFMLAVSVGTYILQSVSLYTIAKRRGIHKPWLSWIPVGTAWIMGCISDQFQYVVKGRVRNKRKALLVLNIIQLILGAAVCVMYVVCFGLLFGMIFQMMGSGVDVAISDQYMEEIIMENIGSMGLMTLLYFVTMGISIAVMIIQYICLYDLYTSCDPRNNVLYLVLGIFVSLCQPIFLFICRNKDGGMPPRRPEPAAYVPEPPVEPWENNPEM